MAICIGTLRMDRRRSTGPVEPVEPVEEDGVPNAEELFLLMEQMMENRDHADEMDETKRENWRARHSSSNPAIHSCNGNCPYMEVNADGTLVCSVLSICWAQTAHNDPATAGIVGGVGEDGVRRRGVARPSKRVRRLDPVEASRKAMILAHVLEDDVDREWTPPPPPPPPPPPLTPQSRNAEWSCSPTRPVRRELEPVQLDALRRDAQETFDRLIAANVARRAPSGVHSGVYAPAPAPTPGLAASSPPNTNAEIRDYIRQHQIGGGTLLLDDLHNIDLNFRRNRVEALRRDGARDNALGRSTDYVELRDLAAALVVCLWQCTLRSPYMRRAKRSSENFRPYTTGVFFSMMRGIYLENGTALVPRCPTLTDAMHRARATHRLPASSLLPLSSSSTSHRSASRGVRTVQMSIASVPLHEAPEFFATAVAAAERLAVAAREVSASVLER